MHLLRYMFAVGGTAAQRPSEKRSRSVRRCVCVLAAVLGVPLCAWADEMDVSGSWQLNTECTPSLVAVRSVDIAEDLPTGALTVTTTDCGTLFFENAIHVVTTCSSPWTGTVSGATFQLAASGPAVDDATFETPFPVAFLGCAVPPLARFIAQDTYAGSVTGMVGSIATEITGTFGYNQAQLFNTDGNVCYNGSAPSGCNLLMRRNAVAPGPNVVVAPYEGATVSFGDVTTGGVVSVTPLNEPAAAVPANFQLLDTPIYFDVSTTALFAGTAAVCLPYPDTNNDGRIDGTTPPIDESRLEILHEEGGVFVDRTVSRNPVTNQICAEVSSFSQFVYGVSNAGCGDGILDPGEACDDGNTADGDCCTSNCQFPAFCRTAGKSLLLLKHGTDPTGDKLTWKWLDGTATNVGELGTPSTTTNYTLCVRSGSASASFRLPSGSSWQATGTTGFKFKNTTGQPDGVLKATLKSSTADNAKALVKGKGTNLPDTLVPALQVPVTVQLVNDSTSVCLESVFQIGDVLKNGGGQFKAKSP